MTVSGDGFAKGEGASYNVTGTITLPGSTSNEFTYSLNDTTKADNYAITKETGDLVVTDVEDAKKFEVTVTAKSDKVTYDGKEHTVTGLEGTSFKWNGQEYTVEGLSASVTGTDTGTYENNVVGTAVVKDAAGNDVTKQFKVTTENGSLKIEQRKVTLTSATDSKTYDGSPLTNGNVIVSGDGFAEDEGASYDVTGTITRPGIVDNNFTYSLNANTKASNYVISVVPGKLTITDVEDEKKHEAKVTANSDTFKYDGNEHTVSGVKGTSFDWNGHNYTIKGLSASVSGINADTYTNKVTGTAVVLDEEGEDVTKQFKVTTQDGSLIINKRNVTLTSVDGEWEYDGKSHKQESVTVTGDGFVGSEAPAYIEYAEITNVATIENTFKYEFAESVNANNYHVTANYGTLKVYKAKPDITIEIDGSKIGAEGFKREYDGTTSTITASAKNSNGAAIDGQFTYSVDGGKATTEVPTFTNSGKWSVEVTTGNQNCEEASVTVTVEITKRKIHLKSIDAEKVYDGKAITDHDKVNVVSGKFVEGEEPVFHTFGTYVDAGEYDNEFSMKFNARPSASLLSRVARYLNPSEDPDHIADNYEITHEYGKVKIKKAASDLHNLDIGDKTVTYNGKEQSLDAATSDIESATIQYSADGGKTWTDTMPAFVDAGQYEVTARAVHGNYEDAEKTAVLTVLPAELVVETESATKEYDGKPLTAGGKLVGVVDGDVIAIKMTGSQTEVGKSKNTYELDFGSTKASNYTITEKLGVLEVTKAAEKPASKPSSKPKQDVPTALGLDPNLWTSIMGVSGAAMIMTVKLSRKEKNKKNKK